MLEVYVSDVHFPFEDKRAWELALKVIRYARPQLAFIGGDWLDCYAVSSFSRDPVRVVNFQSEVDSAVAGLAQLRDAVGAKATIKFLPGNHEERLERWTREHIEASSLTSLRLYNLLKFTRYGVQFVPAYVRIGKLWHIHGNESKGGSVFPAKGVYAHMQGSLIMGHYHKAQVHYNRLLDGTVHGSYCNPCLCKLDQEYIKGISQWQQGISFIEYMKGGAFHVEQVVFYSDGNSPKLNAIWRGRAFSA